MLTKDQLKAWLQQPLSQQDKLLLLLAHFSEPKSIADLKLLASECGLRITEKWNPSSRLARAKPLAIRLPAGWEITEEGKKHLHGLGVSTVSPSVKQIATDLRSYLASLSDQQTRAFVEEAISCYELGLYRSAVVMSWLGAIYVLQRHIVAQHLTAFNVEASKADPKWKPAKTTDDIGRMKESDFLDRINSMSLIGKNAKAELKNCLDLRNGCGHPSSLKLGPNTVARHVEQLLLNVFQQFT